MKIKQVIREHRSIVILFGFELLVLIWAFCLLFGERTVIDINPENADYFNSCTINDGKLQINQSENEVGIDIVSAEYTNIKLKPEGIILKQYTVQSLKALMQRHGAVEMKCRYVI